MKLKIIHKSEYRYNQEVFFEPHYFRFKPKNTSYYNLDSFNIQINPVPAGMSEQFDVENNVTQFCWFDGMNLRLIIQATTQLTIESFNPFNFILYPDQYLKLPFKYDAPLQSILYAALKPQKLSDALIGYVEKILEESKFETLPFLLNLTKSIHADFILETRHEGNPHKADMTFDLKKGSCRDLSWMQIQLLRYVGIGARFVSGYFYIEVENPTFELHAWVEAYLPGAGWIGYDPSHGVMADSAHIPIASSPYHEYTMPVSGSVRGEASSKLITDLKIESHA